MEAGPESWICILHDNGDGKTNVIYKREIFRDGPAELEAFQSLIKGLTSTYGNGLGYDDGFVEGRFYKAPPGIFQDTMDPSKGIDAAVDVASTGTQLFRIFFAAEAYKIGNEQWVKRRSDPSGRFFECVMNGLAANMYAMLFG